MKYKDKEIKEEIQDKIEAEVPFILNFLEHREGATSATTSGAWGDVDASDRD